MIEPYQFLVQGIHGGSTFEFSGICRGGARQMLSYITLHWCKGILEFECEFDCSRFAVALFFAFAVSDEFRMLTFIDFETNISVLLL